MDELLEKLNQLQAQLDTICEAFELMLEKGGPGSGPRPGRGRKPSGGSESGGESRPMSVEAASAHFSEEVLGETASFIDDFMQVVDMTDGDFEAAIEDDSRGIAEREEIGELHHTFSESISHFNDSLSNYADNQNSTNTSQARNAFNAMVDAQNALVDKLKG